jgi:hypothetical protein
MGTVSSGQNPVGAEVGRVVGVPLGAMVGDTVGFAVVGDALGTEVGAVDPAVGAVDGAPDGALDGALVGELVGITQIGVGPVESKIVGGGHSHESGRHRLVDSSHIIPLAQSDGPVGHIEAESSPGRTQQHIRLYWDDEELHVDVPPLFA